MVGVVDLKKLERDAFRRFYEDGLFDIYIGLMLLVFFAASALWDAFGSPVISYLVMLALALGVTLPLLSYRRRLLRARLGSFQPGPRRRLRIRRTRLVLAGSVALGLTAFGLVALVIGGPAPADVVTVLMPLLWFVNAVVVFSAMAYLLDVPRFYAYGVALGTLMPLVIWPDALWGLEVPMWLVFGLVGGALVLIGVRKLRRFLREYPDPHAG